MPIPAFDAAALSIVALRSAGRPSWLFAGAALVALASSGSYKTRAGRTVTADAAPILARLAIAAAVVATLLSSDPTTPRMLRLLPLSAAALLIGRVISYAIERRLAASHLRPVLIAGAGETGVEFANVLAEHPEYGLRPVGFLDEQADGDLPLPLLGSVADLEDVARVFDCRNVIVAFGSTHEAEMVSVLRACEDNRFNIWVIPRFYELGSAAPGPHTLDVWGMPLVEVPRSYTRSVHRVAKRVLDITVSSIVMVLFAPVFGAIALAVKLSSPGPVFFRQERVGRKGRTCHVYKFRSMRVHNGSDTQWTEESQVTAIGNVLRTSSLDELPQLWNVLRGDMSLVGPRPERPHFAGGFAQEIATYDDRHRVAPGMTGWAQVNGLRGDTSISERVRFDNRYIEHESVFWDIAILASTIPAIFRDVFAHLRPRLVRRSVRVTSVVLVMGALVGGFAVAARAAVDPSPVIYKDAKYSANVPPSSDKPQSKLWFHDGSWWGLLQASNGRIDIFRLGSDHAWHDTGTRISDGSGLGDVFDAGSQVYIATRTNSRIEAVRLSYSTSSHSYSVASGPNGIVDQDVESVSIARDGTGTLWITTTYSNRVWVAYSTDGGRRWSNTFHPPGDTTVDADDISAIVSYSGHIGVMWSDQQSAVARFAVHNDGASSNSWSVETATSGVESIDDHLNLHTDGTRVYAVIKTGLNDIGAPPPAPVVSVLVREANGTWTAHTAWQVGTGATRGIGLIDTTNNRFLVYATSPESSGTIYMKSAPLSDLTFPSGKGTPFIYASGALLNNATSMKQNVNASTGVVVLTSDQPGKTYYHAEQPIVSPDVTPPSVPAVQATAVSSSSIHVSWTPSTDNIAVAGYNVYRDGNPVTTTTDSTYVDGGLQSSTLYNYTVEAFDTSGNKSGLSTPAAATTAALGTIGIDFRSSSTASGVDSKTLDVPTPAGVVEGDALLATIDVRGNPAITAPADWTVVRSDQNGFAMKKATYVHVATAAEPATYTWTFSQAQSSTGIMLDYVGVDPTQPVDTSSGSLNTASSKILATGVTTSGSNERIVGLFATTVAGSTTPPSGLSETGETTSSAGTYDVGSETADGSQAVAGPTGDFTASCSFTGSNIGELIALRPKP